MKPIGKIEVHGVGFVDIVDGDSLLIGEYFLDYMTKKLKKIGDIDMSKNGDKRSVMALQKEIEEEKTQTVDEYLSSPQGKRDTLELMQKHESSVMRMSEGLTAEEIKRLDQSKAKPSPEPVKRGRKKGDMMTCDEKIMKYVENKSSFYIKSFVNRQPRFTEDEIKSAIGRLIKENKLYQISNEEIGVRGKSQKKPASDGL